MPTLQGQSQLASALGGFSQEGLHRPSATDQLKGKKARLEAELAKVNHALEALEKSPEVAKAIDAIFEAM